MNKTIMLISQINDLNKFYDNGVKGFASKYLIPYTKMRKIVEGTYDPILEEGNLKDEIIRLTKEHEAMMTKLTKEINVEGLELDKIKIFSGYVEPLDSRRIRNMYKMKMADIIYFSELLIRIEVGEEPFSKEEERFFNNFNKSVYKLR